MLKTESQTEVFEEPDSPGVGANHESSTESQPVSKSKIDSDLAVTTRTETHSDHSFNLKTTPSVVAQVGEFKISDHKHTGQSTFIRAILGSGGALKNNANQDDVAGTSYEAKD